MGELIDQQILLHFLAKKAKELYRENLVFQQVSEWLRIGDNPLFDSLVEDARKSKSIEVAAALFESAIDAKMPPSPESQLEKEIERLSQSLGLSKEKMD